MNINLFALAAALEDELTELEQSGECMETSRDVVRDAVDFALMFRERVRRAEREKSNEQKEL